MIAVARIDLVQRYVGTGRRPRLSTVGGADWGARKAKVAGAVAELAEELLEVQAQIRFALAHGQVDDIRIDGLRDR